MAGILNINSAYNVNSKRIHKRLSFELGEKFTARIINFDKVSSEAILKLLDGWQISANIKDPINFTPNGLVKFEVDGYEDGKLVLRLLNSDCEGETQNLLGDILEELGINVKKEDYVLLEKMLKSKMPLTKENISKIKTLLDFQNKILQDSSKEDSFILKYISNKGIDINSAKGQNIKDTLKGFFTEFKNLSSEDLFALIENNIKLTKDNIRSFNKIVKEPMSVYNEIMDLESGFENDQNGRMDFKEIQQDIKEQVASSGDTGIEEGENHIESTLKSTESNPLKRNSYVEKAYNLNDSKEIDGKEILKKLLEIDSTEEVDKSLNGEILEESTEGENQVIINKENPEKLNNNLQKNENVKKEVEVINFQEENIDTSYKIKEEIKEKTNEMRNLIKQALSEKNSEKPELFSKIVQTLQSKMNDFKVFNSISNQYYYLDVPLNINEREYPCKLIIKDERNKGKKIDSSNVKLVASVNTINMGIIDAYIKVLNKNINIDIKCEKDWINILELGKKGIINKLNDMGYVSNVKVDEKIVEVNIVECRDFFEDNEFTRINLKV